MARLDNSTLFSQDKNILSSHTNFMNVYKAIVYRVLQYPEGVLPYKEVGGGFGHKFCL